MIGLGRMGGNMTERLLKDGHKVVAHTRDRNKVDSYVRKGATGAYSLDEVISKLEKPRAVWIMLPAGSVTDTTVNQTSELLDAGDIVIDGGNSFFKDDIRRGKVLSQKGIYYLDVGTSGGVWGLERGYCLMIGGEKKAVERLDPVFKTLAPGKGNILRTQGREKKETTAELGYLHCGPVGAGHFVKMIHNGIEYGLMQAYAEGFDILQNASTEDYKFTLDLADVAEVWRRGSVVGSWLLDLTATALLENPDLSKYEGSVQDSGEGRWTVMTAIEEGVSADVISASLYARFRSRKDHTFSEKILSAMREKFGGHQENK